MAFPNQVLSCRNCKNNQNLKLETNEAGTFIVCRSCGCRTRLSQPKDEEKSLYFSRYTTGVNELRNLRFDLAAESFREAYGMDPDEPDALWGLVCAEYGIVQVMSYHDQKYSPVFCLVNYRERASFARNMHVLMLRELIARGCKDHDIFDAWLRDVEKQIQKILEATPESHAWKWDVFIACKISETTETAPDAVGKTPEHEEALRLYEELTGRGLRVFYSEKYFVDNMGKPDSDWQIMSALLNSRQMLLVCGGERNDEKLNTPWVRSEWMRWRSMQKQGVKRDDSLIVYSISESTRSLPEGLFTGNTVYPSRRAELLQTLERNCYTDTQYDRDLRKGQELLSRSDFSEASRVFTHTAHMRPDRAEPHVYLFLCDLRVTRLSGLSEKHIESSPESNPHYREAETRNNRASCELFRDLKDRIRFLRDQQKDDKMAKMQEKMEELERQLQEKMKEQERQPQEKTEKTEREERDKKEPPAPMPIQTVRYSQGLSFGKLDDGTYAVTGMGTCKDTKLVIPPTTPEGGKVTQISERAFADQTQLVSVVIPNSVTSIGQSAFSGCSGLTYVTIPNSVESIGKFAFWDCSGLTSVTIPNSVKSIGESPFSYCSGLTSINVEPNNPKYYSQDNCVIERETKRLVVGIQTSRIPNSVTSIGVSVFYGCSSLTSVTIPISVKSIGDRAFCGCSGLTSVTIPNSVNSVTSIGAAAFSGCSGLTSVTIPNSVTSIGGSAFYGCSGLTSVTIPNSVTSIGVSAFYRCSGLTSINVEPNNPKYYSQDNCVIERETKRLVVGIQTSRIPNSVKSIGESAFSYCSGLTSVTIPNSVKSIGESAFSYCSGLTSVTIPNSVTSIGVSAFEGCSGLTSVTIPISVTKIGEGAFGYWYKTTICCAHPSKPSGWHDNWNYDNRPVVWNYKPEGATSATKTPTETVRYSQGLEFEKLADGTYAVKGIGTCKDTELEIPPTTPEGGRVTAIGERAFYECSNLTSVTIPDSVTTIEESAFRWCESLTSVTIPDSVTTIGEEAFSECDGLTSVNIPRGVEKLSTYSFASCKSLRTITIDPSNKKYYSQDNCVIDKNSGELIVGIQTSRIPNGVTAIGKSAFMGLSNLTSVTIPDSVTAIGKWAFMGCESLTSVTIPNSVTTIGEDAFSGCDSLTSVTIPDSVTKIGGGAFEGCNGLTSIIIPSSVTEIWGSFANCGSLTSVTIPDSVTQIGGGAFAGCGSLTSIIIPSSVTEIGDYAFQACDSLASVNIPNSVTAIGEAAFSECSSLASITIPNSVTTIGGYAFSDCSNLTSVTIPDSVTAMGKGVFKACPNVTINCAHPSKPSGWDNNWNPDNRPVVWKNKLKSFFSRLRSN